MDVTLSNHPASIGREQLKWKDVGTMTIKKQRRGIYDSLDSPVVPVFLEEFLFVKELSQEMSVLCYSISK
jgi:hypothetical protein